MKKQTFCFELLLFSEQVYNNVLTTCKIRRQNIFSSIEAQKMFFGKLSNHVGITTTIRIKMDFHSSVLDIQKFKVIFNF